MPRLLPLLEFDSYIFLIVSFKLLLYKVKLIAILANKGNGYMSKPSTPLEQFQKTKNLLLEIRSCSGMKWGDLYAAVDSTLPGLVSCESNVRQLGSGHRYLSGEELSRLAKWALKKGWGGDHARAAIAYVPPSDEEKQAIEQAKRHERYLQEDPMERVIHGPMRMVEQEKHRSVAALDEALAKLSPAGFTHAEILYMVYSWLIKNPPTSQRGSRQRDIVLVPDKEGRGLDGAIYPESFASNFALPEHRNGFPHFIKCLIRSHGEDWQDVLPDKIERDAE